ncbi:cytochrome C [Roseovarius sp. HI0049]|nr:cytochrome C [Roseovarius sp. HI0049]
MKQTIAALTATFALALPAMADETGDPAAGEKAFRQCKACHTIASAEETILRGGRTGPNLYGLPGRMAGAAEDFRYSDLLATAGEQGITWDDDSFAGYVQDPTAWLNEATGESGRGKMTFKVRNAEDAKDLWAYLVSVSPAADGGS